MTALIPTEHQEQARLCQWFWLEYPYLRGCLIAIPNAGKRSFVVGKRMKAEGMTAGVSDLFLMHPINGHAGLWIEMKRDKRAHPRTSEAQVAFQALAISHGYAAAVCYGADQAQQVITAYLNGETHEKLV